MPLKKILTEYFSDFDGFYLLALPLKLHLFSSFHFLLSQIENRKPRLRILVNGYVKREKNNNFSKSSIVVGLDLG